MLVCGLPLVVTKRKCWYNVNYQKLEICSEKPVRAKASLNVPRLVAKGSCCSTDCLKDTNCASCH